MMIEIHDPQREVRLQENIAALVKRRQFVPKM